MSDPRSWRRPITQKDGSVRMARLTIKQQLFIQYYIESANITRSAELAGYKATSKDHARAELVLYSIGSALLGLVWCRAIVDGELAQRVPSPTQILEKLAAQASNDPSKFLREIPVLDPKTKLPVLDPVTGEPIVIKDLDWDFIRSHGTLVKKLEPTKEGWRVEFHDPQKALELLGKYHKMFVDRVANEGEMTVKVVKGVSTEDL